MTSGYGKAKDCKSFALFSTSVNDCLEFVFELCFVRVDKLFKDSYSHSGLESCVCFDLVNTVDEKGCVGRISFEIRKKAFVDLFGDATLIKVILFRFPFGFSQALLKLDREVLANASVMSKGIWSPEFLSSFSISICRRRLSVIASTSACV